MVVFMHMFLLYINGYSSANLFLFSCNTLKMPFIMENFKQVQMWKE